jgi:hypothetical protein
MCVFRHLGRAGWVIGPGKKSIVPMPIMIPALVLHETARRFLPSTGYSSIVYMFPPIVDKICLL